MFFSFSTPVLIGHLWQLKTVVFQHWFLIHAFLLQMVTGCSCGRPTLAWCHFLSRINQPFHAEETSGK